jgi:hypothetical protein
MALPELIHTIVESKLKAYCEKRVPPEVRDRVRLSYRFRGDSVILFEERPSFAESDAWVEIPVAQFRFNVGLQMWTLYCADRNSRWHKYWEIEPDKNFENLLREVDKDPTGIFWG